MIEVQRTEAQLPLPQAHLPLASAAQASEFFAEVREGLQAGSLAPYLGPGVAAWQPSDVPTSAESLAAFLGKKLALPRRARGNMWAAAQYVESQRHRATLKHWL